MRLVIINLGRHGGTTRFGAELANALNQQHEVLYIQSAQADYAVPCKTVTIKTGSSGLENLKQSFNPLNYYKISKALQLHKPDWIIYPSYHAWNPSISCLTHTPKVQIVHDPISHPGNQYSIHRALELTNCQLSSKILVLSKTFISWHKTFFKKTKAISHGGFDLNQPYLPPPHAKKLLLIGRMEAYQGLSLFEKAYPLIKLAHPDAQITIAGRNATSSISEATVLHKWLTDKEIVELIQGHDLIVTPYTSATQSGIIAQAQSLGRAVVTTNVGGLPEQIVHNLTGLVCEPHQVNLSAAINSLLSQPNRLTEMSLNAYELYQNKYNWNIISTQVIQALAP